MTKKSIKTKLFGEVKKMKADGGFTPDMEELKKPFDRSDSIIYFYCTGCGACFEANKKAVDKYLPPTNEALEGKFIISKGCEMCDGGFDDVKLAEIE